MVGLIILVCACFLIGMHKNKYLGFNWCTILPVVIAAGSIGLLLK